MFRYICNIGKLAHFSFLVFVSCLLFKMALVFFFSLPMTKKGNKGSLHLWEVGTSLKGCFGDSGMH